MKALLIVVGGMLLIFLIPPIIEEYQKKHPGYPYYIHDRETVTIVVRPAK